MSLNTSNLQSKTTAILTDALERRILILDGAMGSVIQTYNLSEQAFRGKRFASHPVDLKGNNDVLNITQPDIIADILRAYLEAGADIITTNTLNANAVSMADYLLQSAVYEINKTAAQIARTEADQYCATHPRGKIFVAGSIGPTNKTASMGPDVNNPAFRAVTYDDLFAAYCEQVSGLIDGGADILLIETVFDTLNAKAALDAAETVRQEKNVDVPVMLSLTLAGKGGRTFSGQTLPAFLASISHANIISIGLNCSFGAADMKPHLKELATISPYFISAYPNAGLPNSLGGYDETPATMASHIRSFIDDGLVNIVGGCCGTTPEHIALFPELVKGATPRQVNRFADNTNLWLSGLELLEVKPENNFINVGERCNVAGSRKFLRLIKEEKYDEALAIARQQVEDGAQILDINMDDGMLDAEKEMTVFLNLIASEPDIARVPVMVDSSKWTVIEQALKCIQGKSIVNSISLKEGEKTFLEHASRIRRLGAAVIVMAFDEEGQADTFARKTAVCERAYRLLTAVGFPPQDIIFDPNVLAIATGMPEHNNYGLDFIRAVEWIKQNLHGAKVSGGVSNLSFSFRGNNYVREAMHAVFLYHAIRAGMDMGIVNPSSSVNYEDIDLPFRTLLEDVILARLPEAADELIAYAQQNMQEQSADAAVQHKDAWRELPLNERLEYALVKGIDSYLEEDIAEALSVFDRAVAIIDGPLMTGMKKTGDLFGAGKMFLPQVVKTARTMKRAVGLLQPAIEAEKAGKTDTSAGKIVFATVKGDVHDIGKNIVSIVLTCNNYEVIDLGVMVSADRIISVVKDEKPDILCLSGLITPSLDEMVHVADEMQLNRQKIPLMIGGATTSKIYTAVKIAPRYAQPVVYGADASQAPLLAAKLLNKDLREAFTDELNVEYERLRNLSNVNKINLLSLAEARSRRLKTDWKKYSPVRPAQTDTQLISIPLREVVPFINWTFFFTAWRLNGRYSELADIHECNSCRAAWIAGHPVEEQDRAKEAVKLFDDAKSLINQMITDDSDCIKALYGFFPAAADGDNVNIGYAIVPMLRQQSPDNDGVCLSLADYVMPVSEGRIDYIGAFAVTAGVGLDALKARFAADDDDYSLLLLQTLTDRLAEAAAEYLHCKVRREYWAYAPDETLSVPDMLKVKYRGIRPAVGYPSLPDQRLIFTIDKLLHINQLGVEITENGAMQPTASVAGLFFAHPASKYFMIGRISDEQLNDYARRSGTTAEEARKFLTKNLDL